MLLYNKLKKQLLVNHIIGSFLAILGVGSVFIFHILHLPQNEIFILLFIMLISLVFMYGLEFIVYKHDIHPIKVALTGINPSLKLLKQAYTTAHRLPVLTVRRIMLPHLLGISIPASALTFYCIHTNKLQFPCYYIGFAWCGVILISTLHALIEFFLTERILHPLILHFNQTAKKLYHKSFEIGKFEFISIRRKLLLSSAFIAVFPVLLFTLASTLQLSQRASERLNDYWIWSVILIVIVSLSTFCSVLLYENIKKPIYALEKNILQVRRGKMHPIENTYSDEFAYVISGFNNMIQGMKKRDSQNQLLLESFFTVFAATLDARDPYTAGHSIRVAEYTVKLAKAAGLGPPKIDLLRKSALLHDIGKIGIKDKVLLKEGKLTDEEFEQIKQHPVIGARILEQINLPKELKPLLPGVKYHHERYDGNGYPEGLSGENIPLFGRIMAVADAYDAMTSDRPYRKGMPSEKALSIIHSGKGTQWDPYYAGLFVQIMREN
ncbi:HD domain-containing phosphohydrolase [Ectobacillus polymachus]|uniref:HD domain-containing phosphohydrolase n=1 Tax=Ectobacillus polymachus TaxID=1508806 RepID=UPI003A8BB4AA